MRWLNSVESRLGRFAIPHLTRIVVVLNLLVWALLQVNPRYAEALALSPAAVRDGEVWRLVSYLFIPPGTSAFTLFYLLFLWTMGEGLEHAWGSFRLNLFYLVGMLGTTAAAWFFGGNGTASYLNTSLYYAFATIYPDYPILLFFILQVRIKWLALVAALLEVMLFLGSGWGVRAMILVSLVNYLLFFWPYWRRLAGDRAFAAKRRRQFERAQGRLLGQEKRGTGGVEVPSLHSCRVCGRTDATDPELEFRVSSVDGEEYCREHLPKRPE